MIAPPEAGSKRRPRHRGTVRHSAARLAAVQAIYQLEMTESSTGSVIEEFVGHRLGQADVEASRGANANETLFKELVRGVEIRSDEVKRIIEPLLAKGWAYDRLDVILRCILRLGTFEMLSRVEVPAKVIIGEYVDLADAFFSGSEPGVVNGILDRVAREARASELEARDDKAAHRDG
ncbi:MAG: transcription antitermination factor NusB [Candidatus Tectomicrobia bacterium]